MPRIKKLDPKLVDQIAAGEVIERPASVVKELLDNAIDANPAKIIVKIQSGGVKEISVSDDGCGINKDDLVLAVESHATSKIQSMQDLVNVSTLGFRGEALSSIASVSKIELISNMQDSQAYSIPCSGGNVGKVTASSRNVGTTVNVRDLFYNIPARRKFLKKQTTEYRHIIKVLIPIVLINPDIHFVLESDGKTIYNLPDIQDSSSNTIHPQRITDVIKNIDFINLFYEGNGITIGGMVAHPKHHSQRSSNLYIFVNGRPVWDSGIAKSVNIGARRFIPNGHKVPFVISVNLPLEHVDVNVHPRKVEVRFANPYRIYSAVEQAVRESYRKIDKISDEDVDFNRFRENESHKVNESSVLAGAGKSYSVKESLDFSKMLIQDSVQEEDQYTSKLSEGSEIRARQFMNRYIVVVVDQNLWIVDQHAAAERVRFEKLLHEYEGKGIETQALLLPIVYEFQEDTLLFILEHINVFKYLGYRLKEDGKKINILAIPAILVKANHNLLFKDIVEYLKEIEHFDSKEDVLTDKYRDGVIATMACHSSVRMNRKLSDSESVEIVKSLLRCENSYSCPHGRPIVWKLSAKEIDRHFDR